MKLIKTTVLLVVAVIFSMAANAQTKGNAFKGKITYQISYPESNLDASQLSAMPQFMVLTLSGNKSKAEMSMAGMDQTLLMDSDAKSTSILLTINGQKVAIKPNKDGDRPLGKEPIVEPAGETKEIAGYMCKKANIHFGDEKSKASPISIYYSDELGNNKIFFDNEYRNLTGIPLEFKYKMQGMSMLLTATKIEPGKVKDREFEIPSDYKVTTPEELRKMFGGGM
ncbi:MAG TPA: hypothetical protein VK212_04905 [Lentimicrobium sp.]|nr:hypothetical protein [Lentimicrobium sp.]